MSLTLRTLLSLLLGFIAVGIVYFTLPNYAVKPTGIVLPADGYAPQYKGSVQVFSYQDAPINPDILGTISIQLHSKKPTEKAQQTIISEAKKLTAAAGGKQVVFALGHTSSSTAGFMQMLVLRGTVLK